MSSLHVNSISKSFGETHVLKNVSLSISDGEFVALLGPSGCGKTTLLRTIAGLETHNEGSIRIGNRDVDELGPAQRDIALVFQSYALYPHLTVRQNIAMPLVMRRLRAVERWPGMSRVFPSLRQRRTQILDDVTTVAGSLQIDHLLERKPGQLSGGQKQRVAVARALVRRPSLLLMDEPLSNLDAKLRVQMRREIVALHKQHRATTVYVTHDQVEAMTMADRIAVIFNGELQQIGTPAEIYDTPATIEVAEFVGSPKINILPCRPGDTGVQFLGLHLRSETTPCRDACFIGIRPEHLSLQLRAPGTTACRILHAENLGAEMQITVQAGDCSSQLSVRMNVSDFQTLAGRDDLALAVSAHKPLLFNTAGQRLDTAVSTRQWEAAAA